MHKEYYEAGADIGLTATYNSGLQSFIDERRDPKLKGISNKNQSVKFFKRAVDLVRNASEEVEPSNKQLLVGASIGCFGSGAQTGKEYDGSYGQCIDAKFIEDHHRKRFESFVDHTSADFLAFETIPNLMEVEAILNLLKTRPKAKAWISVICKDEDHLVNGDKLSEFVQMVE